MTLGSHWLSAGVTLFNTWRPQSVAKRCMCVCLAAEGKGTGTLSSLLTSAVPKLGRWKEQREDQLERVWL